MSHSSHSQVTVAIVAQVIHCCRADRANLRDQFGVRLTNVFDTQVSDTTLAYAWRL